VRSRVDQISVTRLDGEQVFTFEEWLALDWAERIAAIRSGHLRFLSKGQVVPLADAIAVAGASSFEQSAARPRHRRGA
jgi:hypothetical protein